MLVLKANTDQLVLVTSAAADIDVHVSAMRVDASTPPVVQPIPDLGPVIPSITTAVATRILDTSGMTSGHSVNVKDVNVRNNHASTSCDVTLQVEDTSSSPTDYGTLFKCTLLAGECLKLTQGGVYIHYDANGGVYPSVGNAALQSDMEAGTSTSLYVTPQGVNWHPGVAKAWAKAIVSAGVPQMTKTWNITSLTDSAVNRVTPVIATDFSSSDYAVCYGIECNTTTYSATTTGLITTLRNATQTVTQFTIDSLEIDIGQTTDPAAWHFVCFGDQ